MDAGGAGHISKMNLRAEQNREALNSHSKKRSGRFFKSKLNKFNLAHRKTSSPVKGALVTLVVAGVMIVAGYFIVQNYLTYEQTKIGPPAEETSDIGIFLSNMDDGRSKMSAEDYPGAIAHFEAALEIFPNNSEAQNALAEATKRLEYTD